MTCNRKKDIIITMTTKYINCERLATVGDNTMLRLYVAQMNICTYSTHLLMFSLLPEVLFLKFMQKCSFLGIF